MTSRFFARNDIFTFLKATRQERYNVQTEAIIKAVQEAGVVGAGGAGFPSHVKLQSKVDLVIANGCECEPLLCGDQYLMETEAQAVVDGLLLAMRVSGAKRGILALKKKYGKALEALKKVVGGNKKINFHLLPDYYPMGDEQVLTYWVTGRTVPAGGIPAQVGTLVHNVTTLAQIARACKGQPVISRKVAVLGEVVEPKVLDAPLGASIRRLIEWAGGVTCEDSAVIIGGPMMGRLAQDLDVPVIKTSGAVLVLPAHHRLVISKKKNLIGAKRYSQAFCQSCGSCQVLCPRRQLGHELKPQRLLRAANYCQPLEFADISGVLACSQCGVCGQYACPMGLSPAVINADLKRSLTNKPGNKSRASAVENWSIPLGVPGARLLHRLGLGKYNFRPPLDERRYNPQRVRLRLKQHLGEPAVSVVRGGDTVKKGGLLAAVPAGKLGANIHASIAGRVEEINQIEIIINS